MRARRARHSGHLNGERHAETLISQVLLWSGMLSIALVVGGLALGAAHGGHHRAIDVHRATEGGRRAHPSDVFVSLSEIRAGLAAHPVRPTAVIALGLALLLLTPVLGVALAIPGFLRDGDYRYAAVVTVVFTLLVLSVLLAGEVG